MFVVRPLLDFNGMYSTLVIEHRHCCCAAEHDMFHASAVVLSMTLNLSTCRLHSVCSHFEAGISTVDVLASQPARHE